MLEGEKTYPSVQNPDNWDLKDNETVVYISIDGAE